MRYFDTHCHLAGQELLPKAEELAQNAWNNNVQGLCLISAERQCLEDVPALAKRLQILLPSMDIRHSIGIHPHDAKTIDPNVLKIIESKITHAHAVGETGLDYYYDHSPQDLQKDLFRFHIELASKIKKPLVIHTRNAQADTLSMLDCPEIHNHSNPGIIHCFTEDLAFAKKAVEWGFMISFSGIVTFKNADSLRQVAKWVPDDRLLIETDSPWLAPLSHRGKRNQPAFVSEVFSTICQLRGSDPEQLSDLIWKNSIKVYS